MHQSHIRVICYLLKNFLGKQFMYLIFVFTVFMAAFIQYMVITLYVWFFLSILIRHILQIMLLGKETCMTYMKADTFNIKVNLNKCIKCTECKINDVYVWHHGMPRSNRFQTRQNLKKVAMIKSVSNESEFERKCPRSNRYQTRQNLKESF